MLHTLNELLIGTVAGHSVSGRNIVVEDIMMNDVRNGSQYQCVVIQDPPNPNIEGNMTILYVAGECKDILLHVQGNFPLPDCYFYIVMGSNKVGNTEQQCLIPP